MMTLAEKRSVVVQRITAGLNEQAVKIVADHIQARQITASSFDALLAKVRQTFPGLPPEVLDAACARLNSAALSVWSDALIDRILDCDDIRTAMMQPSAAPELDLPRRPGDGSFLL